MIEKLHQGDILSIEKIKDPVLVVSKDLFNESGKIIGCPIFKYDNLSPLHISIHTNTLTGYVQCENMKLLDLHVRGYKKIGKVEMIDRIEISDVIQGIFDYV